MTHTLFAIASALLGFLGLDVHIEPAGHAWGFLDFDRVNHGEGEREAWGLGLHIIVSPFPVARTA